MAFSLTVTPVATHGQLSKIVCEYDSAGNCSNISLEWKEGYMDGATFKSLGAACKCFFLSEHPSLKALVHSGKDDAAIVSDLEAWIVSKK